jgi:release factor glutamine methyltransferase
LTVSEILQRSASWLSGKGFSSGRLEAELLLAHVLEAERLDLYVRTDDDLAEPEIDAYRALLRRRVDGEPVAYLTGKREFYGLEFTITSDVLVPRPETELLVDRTRELKPATLLDLCTGSGCVAVACAVRLPAVAVTATDASAAALDVARGNAERHGVSVRFQEGDLFAPVEDEHFDLIVTNPPYVAEGEAPDHEPRLALLAGADGLDVIRRILPVAPSHLVPGGTLLMEIGEDQKDAVRALAGEHFDKVAIHRDLAGHPRVLEAS